MNSIYKLINNTSNLCVGLDYDVSKHNGSLLKDVIDNTTDLACAYKFNLAHYLTIDDGLYTLKDIKNYIPDSYFTILDAKFGDIESTNKKYSEFVFDILGFDSVTLSPYIGPNSIKPFVEYKDKFLFILSRNTSNDEEIQMFSDKQSKPLYIKVAEAFSVYDNIGFVAAGTDTQALRYLRHILPDSWFLIPGIGSQGASAEDINSIVQTNYIINVSRGILNFKDFGFKSIREAALFYAK